MARLVATDLADAARVSLSTVRDFEKGRRVPIANNLEAMKAALQRMGISFHSTADSDALGIAYIQPNQ